MSKKITRKRKRQQAIAKETDTRRISPLVMIAAALLAGSLCLFLIVAPLFSPQNPLTAWNDRWDRLPSSGGPARPINAVKEAYAFAARHPVVTSQLPCFCGCSTRYKHKGLTDCFVKGWTADRYPIWESMGFT